MELPSEFLTTIRNGWGQEGEKFLAALPESISEASSRWNLTDVRPVPMLSYNFVAFALSGASPQGERSRSVVLKMGVPNREFKSEMATLHLFHGNGACRLIDYDEEKYWMLLERLQPGVMLATLDDDEEATHIAADVMQKIWRPISEDDVFYSIVRLVRRSEEIARGPWWDRALNEKLVRRAIS
jgi:streptomycin 6-kinase